MKNKIEKAVILLIWLCIWQITAVFVGNRIYFATPYETLKELAVKASDPSFRSSVLLSLFRILSGFFTAFISAYILAFASLRFRWLRDFLSPFVTFLKSVPVAAVVVILLIWWGTGYLVLCIGFMVVFPNIYSTMLSGLQSTDKKLLEMSKAFDMKPTDRLLWIYRPSYLPGLHSAMEVSLGMCFKSGIAAEVIGLPELSIGDGLYRDKIYLNTAGVFAWIIVILLVCTLTEKFLLFIAGQVAKVPDAFPEKVRKKASDHDGGSFTSHAETPANGLPEGLSVFSDGVFKEYDGRIVTDTELSLKKGKIYLLNDPSGSGKTTLLEMIAGLRGPDKGTILSGKCSMAFQDDRLVESANSLRNLMITGATGDAINELKKMIPEHSFKIPVSELSGGERKRLGIIRAFLHPSDIVLIDEPFSGLDDENAKAVAEWMLSHQFGRTLIIVSHGLLPDTLKEAEKIPLISGR